MSSRFLACLPLLGLLLTAPALAEDATYGVGPQYDSTHVYVAPDDVLVEPFVSDHRQSAMVQFPGGYVAEIHAAVKP